MFTGRCGDFPRRSFFVASNARWLEIYVLFSLYRLSEGGPSSRYSKQIENNTWSGSETIIAMTFAAAREWAEARLSAEAYQAEFETEDEDKYALSTFRLAADVKVKLDQLAKNRGATMTAVLETLIREA